MKRFVHPLSWKTMLCSITAIIWNINQNELILTPVILEVSQMNITKFNQLMFTNSIRSLALKAPTKRSQHANATCQRNISQQCWAQRAVCVWPPCCDMLGVVGSSLKTVKFVPTTPNVSQHGAQNARNMLHSTMVKYVRWLVAIVWPGLNDRYN